MSWSLTQSKKYVKTIPDKAKTTTTNWNLIHLQMSNMFKLEMFIPWIIFLLWKLLHLSIYLFHMVSYWPLIFFCFKVTHSNLGLQNGCVSPPKGVIFNSKLHKNKNITAINRDFCAHPPSRRQTDQFFFRNYLNSDCLPAIKIDVMPLRRLSWGVSQYFLL